LLGVQALGVFGIAVYAIGIPVLFFYLLRANKDKLNDPETIGLLGFLYCGYAATFWLGELVEMTRKLVMSGVIMFVTPGSVMQIIMAVLFCIVFLGMQLLCNPFEEEVENKVVPIW
jgi:hypothetical protein